MADHIVQPDPFADAHIDTQPPVQMSAAIQQQPPQPSRQDSRQKPSRSATTQAPPVASSHGPSRPRRSLSEDSSSPDIRVARAANTRTKSHGAVSGAKAKEKPSAHADVVDQWDVSGVGGGMFHHESPFDACAPSRNRSGNARQAPVYAFDNVNGGTHNVPVLDKRLSPLAQATIAAMASSDGPYPSAALMPPSQTSLDRPGGTTMLGAKLGPTARKMTLTEAWGKAEPEPFEEFSAGTVANGSTGFGSTRSSFDAAADPNFDPYHRRDREPRMRRGESLDVPMPRRTRIPPPQPILLPGQRAAPVAPTSPDPSSPTTEAAYATDYVGQKPTITRTKSLMQRFKRMRENPNVPVTAALPVDGGYSSEYSSRDYVPGSRVQDMSERMPLPRTHGHAHRPSKEHNLKYSHKPDSPEEPFVIVDSASAAAAAREKALPPPPMPPTVELIYQERIAAQNGFGRKPSLYQKVKGVVGKSPSKQ